MNKFKFATSSAIALVGLGLATPLPVLAETKPNVVSVDDLQTKIDNLKETISKLESSIKEENRKLEATNLQISKSKTLLDEYKKQYEENKDVNETAITYKKYDVEKLKEKLATAKENKAQAQKALDEATKEKTILADKIAETEKENQDKISEIKNLVTKENSTISKLDTLKTTKVPRPKLPTTYGIYELNEVGGKAKEQTGETLANTVENNKNYSIPQYVKQGENETVDITNLTDSQSKELNEFTAKVINDIREQLGYTPVSVTSRSIKSGKQVADNYQKDNYLVNKDNFGKDINATTLPVDGEHSPVVSSVVNSRTTLGTKVSSMDNIKEDIYNAIMSIVFNSNSSTPTSRVYSLLDNPNSLGIGYSYFPEEGVTQIHFTFSSSDETDPLNQDSGNYQTLYEQENPEALNVYNTELAPTQEKLQKDRTDYQTNLDNLDTYNRQLKELENDYDNSEIVKTRKSDLQKATEEVTNTKTELANTKTELENMINAYKFNQEYETKVAEENKKLDEFTKYKEDSEHNLEAFNRELDETKAELAKLENNSTPTDDKGTTPNKGNNSSTTTPVDTNTKDSDEQPSKEDNTPQKESTKGDDKGSTDTSDEKDNPSTTTPVDTNTKDSDEQPTKGNDTPQKEPTRGNDTTTPTQEDNNKSAEVETTTEETTRNSETKATDTNSQENSPVEDSKADNSTNTFTEDNKPIEVKYNTKSQNEYDSNKELPKASISNLISLSLGMSILGGTSLKGKKRNSK